MPNFGDKIYFNLKCNKCNKKIIVRGIYNPYSIHLKKDNYRINDLRVKYIYDSLIIFCFDCRGD